MTVFQQTLNKYAADLTAKQIDLLENHWRLVEQGSKIMNLTAIRDEEAAAVLHYLDSLLVLPYLEGTSSLDIGSGAGFPGMPLALLRPQIKFTLLDSTGKKCRFISDCVQSLKVANVTVYQARAEEAARQKQLRACFDTVTARAVSSLPTLLEYALPFLKIGCLFIAMKGPSLQEELVQSKAALCELKAEIEQVVQLELPSGERRCLVLIRKKGQTPYKYPRDVGNPQKMPL